VLDEPAARRGARGGEVRGVRVEVAAVQDHERLIPYRRKEILRYLNNLKRPETLERNIEKVLRARSVTGNTASCHTLGWM
jgi:hypothetical protein